MNNHEDGPPNIPVEPRDRATLLPERERDTSPEDLSLPSVKTMLDPTAMGHADSEFMALARQMIETGRAMAAEREERREAAEQSAQRQQTLIDQQGEIVKILTRTEKATEANYKILEHHFEELKKAMKHHADRLGDHDSQLDNVRTELGSLRDDMTTSVAGAIERALSPYVERIEAIERRCGARNDA